MLRDQKTLPKAQGAGEGRMARAQLRLAGRTSSYGSRRRAPQRNRRPSQDALHTSPSQPPSRDDAGGHPETSRAHFSVRRPLAALVGWTRSDRAMVPAGSLGEQEMPRWMIRFCGFGPSHGGGFRCWSDERPWRELQ